MIPNHYITSGLSPNEMPGPADQITAMDAAYHTLVEGAVTHYPSLIIATYGQGRILVQLDNPASTSLSDEVYRRMINWVSGWHSDVQFSSASYGAAEDSGSALISVTLSAASAQTVTVAYATSNGTATAGSDYTAASGTLTFKPGMTLQVFDVPLFDDTITSQMKRSTSL